MRKPGMNLQDSFLNQARRDNLQLSVQLVTGRHLEGRVSGFDNFTLILDDGNSKHLIYKHGIALISPVKPAGPERSQKKGEAVRTKVFNDSLKRKLESSDGDKKP